MRRACSDAPRWVMRSEASPRSAAARSSQWVLARRLSSPLEQALTEAERAESIDCLLRVKRPRAALHAVGQQVKGVETTILKRLLFNLATVHDEPVGPQLSRRSSRPVGRDRRT